MLPIRIDKKRLISKSCAMLFLLTAVLLLTGFQFPNSMPFNGDVQFHDLSINIPESYIRDSTQSNEDFWIFEKGWYSSYIMLSHNDLVTNADAYLDDYAAYLREQGATSRRGDYMQLNAVLSSDVRTEMPWRELLFVHGDSVYAVALRGGSELEFLSILRSISINLTDSAY